MLLDVDMQALVFDTTGDPEANRAGFSNLRNVQSGGGRRHEREQGSAVRQW